MGKLFAILLASMFFCGIFTVPFINLLYYLKFQQPRNLSIDSRGQKTLYNDLHGWKVGTPIGGGILIIFATFFFSLIFYALTKFRWNWTAQILFLTLFLFGALGLYDDLKKFFHRPSTGIWALRIRYKFALQWVGALLISFLLWRYMGLDSVSLPYFWGELTFTLGPFYILFAATLIVFFSNAFNISDGMDGLASGLLLLSLAGLWILCQQTPFHGDIGVFIATLFGALIPFLYFNIYPARIFMGDTGALAFGALLAVIALMINQGLVLFLLGGVFVVEALSSLIQLFSIAWRNGKKIFLIAPLHHHLEAKGWSETKVTMRLWLFGLVCLVSALFWATFHF